MGRQKALLELLPNIIMQARDSEEWERRKRALRTNFGCSIVRYRSTERTSAGYLILSDLIPKNKPIY